MANFPSFTFTAAGRAAITRSLSGKDVDRLIITKCVLGDGVYSGDIDSLKDVTSPKMTVTVSEYTDNGDGTSVTRFVYDNASLDVGFMHREMGIYAKNGDSGTELLLCYSNAGDEYSYIKAGAVDSVTKQRKATIPPQTFKFVLATGGSGSVNAVIDPKGYVDVEMLEEHNTDPTAHPDIRQKLNAVDAKANTNASNITALQTSDNAKFKAVSVSNDTLTFTKGDNTTTAVTVNNVANATNASYTTTQAATDNSTKIASTAFVQTAVSQLVNSAPSTLDTLNELANALGDDPNFATTVSTQIGQKADKTELATHNTDISSHPAITAMIAKITGNTNWQENPVATLKDIKNTLGYGGIVAQRFDINGYVKFANGFTIQWGYDNTGSQNTPLWVNYPITFTSKPTVVASIVGDFNDSMVIADISNTGFSRFSHQSFNPNMRVIRPCCWIAVGF